MSKIERKNAHQINLWQVIDFGLKKSVLCYFYNSQVLQVEIFYMPRAIEEKPVFDYNVVTSQNFEYQNISSKISIICFKIWQNYNNYKISMKIEKKLLWRH